MCCSGMSLVCDKLSVGKYQLALSLLACTQFDVLGYSLKDSLVVPNGYILSVGEFQFVPSLLTCPNLDGLLKFYFDMTMPALMVVVSMCLLWRVFGFAPMLHPWRAGLFDGLLERVLGLAPLLLPWFAGNIDGFSNISALEGKGKKERDVVLYFSDFCFSQASFSAAASAYLTAAFVWLLVVSLSCSVVLTVFKVAAAASQLGCKHNVAAAPWCAALLAAAHVSVYKDVFELGIASVILVTFGGAFNVRFRVAAAAAWYAWAAAVIAFMYVASFVFGFFVSCGHHSR